MYASMYMYILSYVQTYRKRERERARESVCVHIRNPRKVGFFGYRQGLVTTSVLQMNP